MLVPIVQQQHITYIISHLSLFSEVLVVERYLHICIYIDTKSMSAHAQVLCLNPFLPRTRSASGVK